MKGTRISIILPVVIETRLWSAMRMTKCWHKGINLNCVLKEELLKCTNPESKVLTIVNVPQCEIFVI